MSAGFYLGVDGGGTKTEFVCLNASGAERIRFSTGGTYHPEIGVEEVVARLRLGIERACAAMEVDAAALSHVFFGLPAFGEDSAADARIQAACGDLLGHDRYTCSNDMICGWAGSLACGDGINVIAGTGSIAYGRCGEHEARAGGWGEIFSDEGSAYWVAVKGLTAFSRMSDGRTEKGPLYTLLRERLDLRDDIDLCSKVMTADAKRREDIAALAPLISQAAQAGDSEAAAILDDAGSSLAKLALAIRRSLPFAHDQQVAVSWSGSVFTKAEAVRQRFVEQLEAQASFDFVEPRHDPAYGAALYARELAGKTAA